MSDLEIAQKEIRRLRAVIREWPDSQIKYLKSWYSGSRKKMRKMSHTMDYLLGQISERDKALNVMSESSDELLQMLSDKDLEIARLKAVIISKAEFEIVEVA